MGPLVDRPDMQQGFASACILTCRVHGKRFVKPLMAICPSRLLELRRERVRGDLSAWLSLAKRLQRVSRSLERGLPELRGRVSGDLSGWFSLAKRLQRGLPELRRGIPGDLSGRFSLAKRLQWARETYPTGFRLRNDGNGVSRSLGGCLPSTGLAKNEQNSKLQCLA